MTVDWSTVPRVTGDGRLYLGWRVTGDGRLYALGRTPLHLAICKNGVPFELVDFLVGRGPGALQKADNCGSLPLHVACFLPH